MDRVYDRVNVQANAIMRDLLERPTPVRRRFQGPRASAAPAALSETLHHELAPHGIQVSLSETPQGPTRHHFPKADQKVDTSSVYLL